MWKKPLKFAYFFRDFSGKLPFDDISKISFETFFGILGEKPTRPPLDDPQRGLWNGPKNPPTPGSCQRMALCRSLGSQAYMCTSHPHGWWARGLQCPKKCICEYLLIFSFSIPIFRCTPLGMRPKDPPGGVNAAPQNFEKIYWNYSRKFGQRFNKLS